VLTIALVVAVFCVAFTNGANANFKGVASLYGSGTTSLRMALYWGTGMTFAGSMLAWFLGGGLLKSFSGRGIVDDRLVQSPSFATAVAVGAALTSFLATRAGFPVSTTHALVGALFGAGLVGSQSTPHLDALLKSIVFPLFFSPIVALVLGWIVYKTMLSVGWPKEAMEPSTPMADAAQCTLPSDASPVEVAMQDKGRNKLLDRLHFLSAGAASFARGWNDTPKIAALMLLVPHFDAMTCFVLVAVGILLGGLLDAEGVAETLGKKVTGMNAGQGFAASLVTAGLVSTASWHSLPVSTTHVSVGSLLGIGIANRRAHWKKVFEILLAWITTAPCGALLAALTFLLLSQR
jgi:PiT family inorganic phosphate transporter